MIRAVLILFVLTLPQIAAAANAAYIAQSSAGANDGTSCANAKAVDYFNTAGNWSATPTGIQIGPATTVHLCGTFTGTANTTMLTIQGSGSSGNPVTILFETGAKLTAPYWTTGGGGGAISCDTKNFITIDGGTNGLIMATANGSSLANQKDSRGITAVFCSNFTVKNMTITAMYLRTVSTDDCACSDGIFARGGQNITISNNTLSDATGGVNYLYDNASGGSANINVFGNVISNTSTGINIGEANPGDTVDIVNVYSNDLCCGLNWDGDWTGLHGCSSGCHFHNNGLHIYAVNTGNNITNLKIYNNYVHGDWGTQCTAALFPEGFISNHLLYNNLIVTDNHSCALNGYILVRGPGTGAKVFNNTVVSISGGIGIELVDVETGVLHENNIYSGVGTAVYVPETTSNFTTSNFNDYYNVTNWSYQTGQVTTFADYKAQCGCDSGSTISNPNLDGTHHLQAGSPMIGFGANFSAYFTTDKNGVLRPGGATAWDTGVYISSGGVPAPPAPSLGMFAKLKDSN